MIYTGSGLMGREAVNIRSSDIVVSIGGHSGTLGEFSIAYDEGKLIGVLLVIGGITTEIKHIVKKIKKKTGARILYDDNPRTLVKRLVRYYRKIHYRHQHPPHPVNVHALRQPARAVPCIGNEEAGGISPACSPCKVRMLHCWRSFHSSRS
jgi:SLOG cluster4 family